MGFAFLFLIFVGLASGLAVGSGLVAFLTILGVIPRLVHLTKTQQFFRFYGWAAMLCAIFYGWLSVNDFIVGMSIIFVIIVGLFTGIFIGILAAALFEVLNVIPILSKRIGFQKQVAVLLMAIAFGKVFGSLFQWLIFDSFHFH